MTIETKITRWTCEHPNECEGTITRFVKRPGPQIANPSPWAQMDWDFTLDALAKRLPLGTPGYMTYPDFLETVQICSACSERLPSVVAHLPKQTPKPPVTEEETLELQDYLDRVEAGSDSFYFCPGCNEFKEPEDLVPLRECPHCDEVFDGNEGRNCPSCNRPFSRNLEVEGCPDCLDAEAPPEFATVELIKQMMETT